MPDVHPPLYAGINFDALNSDDYNGGGVNPIFYVDLADADTPGNVGMTQSTFWGVIDGFVGAESRDFSVPRERRSLKVRS